MSGTIVFVLKGYPRLSETFIAQEIHALEKHGISLRIVSLRHPTEKFSHPVHRRIKAPVQYLPEYLHKAPWLALKSWWAMRRHPGYPSLLRQFKADYARDRSRSRIRRLGQAIILAHSIRSDDIHLHAHFLHTPATVAYYTSFLTGLRWSTSAHAKDIWISSDWEIKEKLASCQWAVTCTKYNHDYLTALAGADVDVSLVYHGLDLSVFSRQLPRAARDEVIILSVGRLVAKKGYSTLLDALFHLKMDSRWRFVHIGDGPLKDELVKQACDYGISDRIQWLGAQPQNVVLENYRNADLFVLASCIASDGDRDGLPNVLMEAQSQELPCVATATAAIPELISDGYNGLLVSVGDSRSLAFAISRLVGDPELRQELGKNALNRLSTQFSLDETIRELCRRFTSISA